LLVAAGVIQELTPALEELRAYFNRDPALLLGVHCDRHLAGLAVGSFDGYRGHLRRVAVKEAVRGRGLGTELIVALEARLVERGARLLRLHVNAQRPDVEAFWRKHDYRPIPVSYFGKTVDVRPSRQADPMSDG
jgi:GNAT superfamily N-acetyltransferase